MLAFLTTMPFLCRLKKADLPSLPDLVSPMPVEANGHPTTMTSPRKPVASVPLKIVSTERPGGAGIGGIGGSSTVANVSVTDAIYFFVCDWVDVCGETIETFENLQSAYDDFRKERPWFPEISPKKLSQTLTALGSRRMSEDRRRKGKDGRRLVVFEVRTPRKVRVQQKRAAA